jgi:PGF-pre-PGF domain-containing protein
MDSGMRIHGGFRKGEHKWIFVAVVVAAFLFAGVAGAEWSYDVRLTNDASESWGPAIALNGSNIHVVWHDNRDENYEIYYKNSTDAGVTWSSDVRLTNAASTSEDPSIALNGSNIHVVWEDNRDGNYEIYYKNSTDAGVTWSSDVRLTNNASSSGGPVIAVNGNNLHVVWDDNRDGNYEIYYKNSTDAGVTWSSDVRLTNDAGYSYLPSIALNGSNIHVVWWDNRDGNYEIYYKNSTDAGVTWSSDVRLTNDASDSRYSTIALSESNTHVVWEDNRDGNYEIYYKNSTDAGVTWSSDVRLTNNIGHSYNPSIAVNGNNIHVVWDDDRDGNDEIYYKNSTDNGATWSGDVMLTNDASGSDNPAIALSESNTHVVWYDNRDGNWEIYYKRSPAFPPPNITSWSNTKTNDTSLNITINVSEVVTFNATANQSGNMSWYKNGTFQYNNSSVTDGNFTTSWASPIEPMNVSVNITNANGTSGTLRWNVSIAPVITNVTNSTVSVSGNSPKTYITWDTDESADSLVRFGKFSGNLKQSQSNATMTLAHNETMNDLDYGITYYYNVTSQDSSNNSHSSAEYNFTTPACTGSGGSGTANIYGLVANSSDGKAGVNATNKGFAIAYNVAEGTSDTADSRESSTQMNNGYFWFDAGALWANWAKCDDVVVVTEVNNTVSKNGANYTASTRRNKSLENPDTFHPSALEKIPTPLFSSNGTTWLNITWTGLLDEHSNVVNYSVYRSTDNISYSFINNSSAQVSNGAVYYNDTNLGVNIYYYKLRVRFRGGYQTEGYSNASAPMYLTLPLVAFWGNTKTNNASLTLTVNTSEAVTFNATTNQAGNISWYMDGGFQFNNSSATDGNFTTSWNTTGSRTVTVNATNANGTGNTVTWNVTVVNAFRVVNTSTSSPCAVGFANYSTLQSAINAASNGDTIIVCAGQYNESITVNKSVTITANNSTYDVTVNSSSNANDTITVTNSSVNISWLNVQNATDPGRSGINVSNASYANLSNNWLTSNYYGIYLSNANNSTLANNNASNNSGDGVYLNFSFSNTLMNNTASNNTDTGIFFYSSTNNTILNSTANGTNQSYGIRIESNSTGNQIINNNFSSNTAYGMWSDNTSSFNWTVNGTSLVQNNSVMMNGNVTVQNGGNLTLSGVVLQMNVSANGQYGIEVQNGGRMSILDYNWARSNITNGAANGTANYTFVVRSGASFTMRNSELHRCGYAYEYAGDERAGLIIKANNTTVDNNTLTSNYIGIHLFQSNNSTVINNNASGNAYGILLDSSINNTLAGNTANINANSGIYLQSSSSNNTLTNNTLYNNTCDGIYLNSSTNNIIDNNNVSNNNYGISLYYSANNTLTNNTANNNKWDGIFLNLSANNTISSNIANLNVGSPSSSGIYLTSSSSYNKIIDNNASNNFFGIVVGSSSKNNSVANNTVTFNNQNGIHLSWSSDNNVIRDNTVANNSNGTYMWVSNNTVINGTITNSTNYDFYLINNSHATALNVSFNHSSIFITDTSNLTVKWYLDVLVQEASSGNPLQDAVVNATNVTGAVAFPNINTSASGIIPTQELIEYVNNSTAQILYRNYTVNASKSGYSTATNSSVNLTANTLVVLTLGDDTVAPTVNITFPTASNIAYRKANATLVVNFTYTEFSPRNYSVNISNATDLINTSNNITTSIASGANVNGNCTFWINTSAADGVYNITFVMYDNSSNNNSDTEIGALIVDNTTPILSINSPNETSPAYNISGGTAWVNFTYNETYPMNYTINISNATTSINTTTNTTPTGSNTSQIFNLTFILNSSAADGKYNVTFTMYDNATNVNVTYQNYSVIVDNVAPNITNETPKNQSYTNDQFPLVSTNITDSGSGTTRCTIRMYILGGEYCESGCGCAVEALNVIGDSSDFYVWYDYPNKIGNGTVVNVLVNASDNSSRLMSRNWSFTIDAIMPVFLDFSPANNTTTGDSTPAISVDMTDTTAGVNSSTVRMMLNNQSNWTNVTCANTSTTNCTTISNGIRITYTRPDSQNYTNGTRVNITVNATDNAGNENTTSWYFDINEGIPSASNPSPANGSFINNSTPQISVHVTNSQDIINNSTIILTVNGVSYSNNSSNFTLYKITNGVNVTLNSTLLNFANGQAVSVTLNANDTNDVAMYPPFNWSFTVDTAAPNASGNSPVSYTNASTPSITVNVNDTVSGVNNSTINMSINGTRVTDTNVSISGGFNISYGAGTFSDNQTVYVNVTVCDNAVPCNQMTFNWSFVVDLSKPNVSVSSPQNNSTYNASVPLTFTPLDNIATTLNCSRNLDGNSLGIGNFTNNSANTTTVTASNGSHSLNITCTDYAGNSNTSVTLNFTVDANAPNATGDRSGVGQTSATLTATTNESATCRYYASDAGYDTMTNMDTTGGTMSHSHTFSSSLTCGTDYDYYIRCMDAVGNKMSSPAQIPRFTTSACDATPTATAAAAAGAAGGAEEEEEEETETPSETTAATPAETATSTPSATTVVSTVASTPSTTTETTTQVSAEETKTISSVSAGGTTRLFFSEVSVKSIAIKVKNAVSDVTMNVKTYQDKPSGVTKVSGTAYEYMEIDTQNIEDSDIESVTINFKVTKSWITSKKFADADVKLQRYSGSKWSSLPTSKSSEDATYTYFDSKSPGLSVFAIVAEPSVAGAPLIIPVIPIIAILVVVVAIFAVMTAVRSPRMQPFIWRLKVRHGRGGRY